MCFPEIQNKRISEKAGRDSFYMNATKKLQNTISSTNAGIVKDFK